ncbi:MAG: hypothetical protein HC802_16750, partial [Caldilineaceae bacterium]|nr:hypothetical protein [Caldilineaceae bacterium]
QPPYVFVNRPGDTENAYRQSSAEILAGPLSDGAVSVRYTLYDPDGARSNQSGLDSPGSEILSTEFEFSTDGGGRWRTATLVTDPLVSDSVCTVCDRDEYNCPAFVSQNAAQQCYDYCLDQVGSDIHNLDGNDSDGVACENNPIYNPEGISRTPVVMSIQTGTLGTGVQTSVLWDARANQAIGDDARFRVRIVPKDPVGPIQRSSSAAISPPFRVRAVTCVWPEDPAILVSPATAGAVYDYEVDADTEIAFTGKVAEGSGSLTYQWAFYQEVSGVAGSMIHSDTGQVIYHALSNGPYVVKMTVTGTPCPATRSRTATIRLAVGTGATNLYLPLVMNGVDPSASSASAARSASGAGSDAPAPAADPGSQPPTDRVEGLNGRIDHETGALWLYWQPYAQPQQISGLRVSQGPRDADELDVVATLPPAANAHVIEQPACDQRFVVTAFNPAGVSLPSRSTYYTLPCSQE